MTEPTIIKPEDINPNYNWHRRVPSHGRTNVDYEERINFPRLHKYRPVSYTHLTLPTKA